MARPAPKTLKQRLEAVWQDGKCRSPNGSIRWLAKQTHWRHKPASDDLFYCPSTQRQTRTIRRVKRK